jgi:hypothetical protein
MLDDEGPERDKGIPDDAAVMAGLSAEQARGDAVGWLGHSSMRCKRISWRTALA